MLRIGIERQLIEFEGSAEDLLALSEGLKKAAQIQQHRPHEIRVEGYLPGLSVSNKEHITVRFKQGKSVAAL